MALFNLNNLNQFHAGDTIYTKGGGVLKLDAASAKELSASGLGDGDIVVHKDGTAIRGAAGDIDEVLVDNGTLTDDTSDDVDVQNDKPGFWARLFGAATDRQAAAMYSDSTVDSESSASMPGPSGMVAGNAQEDFDPVSNANVLQKGLNTLHGSSNWGRGYTLDELIALKDEKPSKLDAATISAITNYEKNPEEFARLESGFTRGHDGRLGPKDFDNYRKNTQSLLEGDNVTGKRQSVQNLKTLFDDGTKEYTKEDLQKLLDGGTLPPYQANAVAYLLKNETLFKNLTKDSGGTLTIDGIDKWVVWSDKHTTASKAPEDAVVVVDESDEPIEVDNGGDTFEGEELVTIDMEEVDDSVVVDDPATPIDASHALISYFEATGKENVTYDELKDLEPPLNGVTQELFDAIEDANPQSGARNQTISEAEVKVYLEKVSAQTLVDYLKSISTDDNPAVITLENLQSPEIPEEYKPGLRGVTAELIAKIESANSTQGPPDGKVRAEEVEIYLNGSYGAATTDTGTTDTGTTATVTTDSAPAFKEIQSGVDAAKVLRDKLGFSADKTDFTLDDLNEIAANPDSDKELASACTWFINNNSEFKAMEIDTGRIKRNQYNDTFNIDNLKGYINNRTVVERPKTEDGVNDSYEAVAILYLDGDFGNGGENNISYKRIKELAAGAPSDLQKAAEYFVAHQTEFTNMETDFGREGTETSDEYMLFSKQNALDYYNRNNTEHQKLPGN
jgi:hypothetical protein